MTSTRQIRRQSLHYVDICLRHVVKYAHDTALGTVNAARAAVGRATRRWRREVAVTFWVMNEVGSSRWCGCFGPLESTIRSPFPLDGKHVHHAGDSSVRVAVLTRSHRPRLCSRPYKRCVIFRICKWPTVYVVAN